VLDSPNFFSAMGKLAGKVDKNIVLKVGKALKYKFKPWQAGTIARRISQSVPYINAASTAWDIGSVVVDNIKAGHAAKRIRELKAEMKRVLESDFSEAIYKVFAPIEALAFIPDEWKSKQSLLSEYAKHGVVVE
jgi:hypothetical protein